MGPVGDFLETEHLPPLPSQPLDFPPTSASSDVAVCRIAIKRRCTWAGALRRCQPSDAREVVPNNRQLKGQSSYNKNRMELC